MLWELGADVVKMGVEPNGFNINQDCGSTAPEAMLQKVREMRADFGISLDGDADRVVMADEKGRIIDGDQILALIARSWAKKGALKGGGVVGTVMSNTGLERYLSGLKLKLARAAVGDRYVAEEMREGGFNVGGEQSGHIVLSDFTTTGDGLIAALQVLAVLAEEGEPASKAAHLFEPRLRCWKMCALRTARRSTTRVSCRKSAYASSASGAGGSWCANRAPSPSSASWREGDDEKLVRAVVRDVAALIHEAS